MPMNPEEKRSWQAQEADLLSLRGGFPQGQAVPPPALQQDPLPCSAPSPLLLPQVPSPAPVLILFLHSLLGR